MPIPPTPVASAADALDDSRWLSSKAVREAFGVRSVMTLHRLRKRGFVPEPDAQVGGRNFWRADTIRQAKEKIERTTREARESGSVPITAKATEARAERRRAKRHSQTQPREATTME